MLTTFKFFNNILILKDIDLQYVIKNIFFVLWGQTDGLSTDDDDDDEEEEEINSGSAISDVEDSNHSLEESWNPDICIPGQSTDID